MSMMKKRAKQQKRVKRTSEVDLPDFNEADFSDTGEVDDSIPAYWPVQITGYLLVGIGIIAGIIGALLFVIALGDSGDQRLNFAFVAIVLGLLMFVVGSLLLMLVDMAHNTWRTVQLLERLNRRLRNK